MDKELSLKMEEPNLEDLIGEVDINTTSETNIVCNFTADGETQQLQSDADQTVARRKDTKDSGYGDIFSEYEQEQEFIPDWCQEYQNTHEDISEQKDPDDIEKQKDDVDIIIDELKQCDHGQRKPAKRHRRITPVPPAAPVKLCIRSTPDFLFVDEEDVDDVKNFNSEDDFMDQGFIAQMAESPIWRRKATELKINSDASEMDGQKVEPEFKHSLFRCLSENAQCQLSEDCCHQPKQGLPPLQAEKNDNFMAVDHSKLYFRSKSENDSGQSALRSNNTSASAATHTHQEFGKVSRIVLKPAAALPEWMREAGNYCDQYQSRETPNSTPFNTSSQHCEQVGEDIIKIYLPQKDDKAKKGTRGRKLTPARAKSPLLDKLSGLQSQTGLALSEDREHEDS